MNKFISPNPLTHFREQKKRDKRAKAAEEKIKETVGDNTTGKLLGKVAGFFLKQDPKRY